MFCAFLRKEPLETLRYQSAAFMTLMETIHCITPRAFTVHYSVCHCVLLSLQFYLHSLMLKL